METSNQQFSASASPATSVPTAPTGPGLDLPAQPLQQNPASLPCPLVPPMSDPAASVVGPGPDCDVPTDSAPPTPPSAPAPRPKGRRKGKVARLPDRARELVNLMLRDGQPYPEIIKKLAEHGHTLSTNNLSRWHAGGFQDWLHEENLLDDLRTRLDFATDVVNPKGAALIQEASLRIAILRMYRLLLRFDPVVLQDKISENPGAYARILNALCKLTSGAVACERLRLEQADD